MRIYTVETISEKALYLNEQITMKTKGKLKDLQIKRANNEFNLKSNEAI